MNKVLLVVLDGFGHSNSDDGNALKLANMDTYNEIVDEYPHVFLGATGEEIGLPDDVGAECEIGHFTMGAGKPIKQSVTILNEVLGSTLIEKNEKMLDIIEKLKASSGRLHLIGLASDGMVHSDITYMKNFVSHLKNMGLKNLYFHALADGKDVESKSCSKYMDDLLYTFQTVGLGKLATICGRKYAMDKDNNWNRIKKYTDLLINGVGISVKNYKNALKACYDRDLNDDVIPPIILDKDGVIKEDDIVIWLNYRIDTGREILSALGDITFKTYNVGVPNNVEIYSVLENSYVNVDYLIEANEEIYPLGKYLSDLGLKQARICEDVKFDEAIASFDGGKVKLKGCDIYRVPSLNIAGVKKDLSMSLNDELKELKKALDKDYNFILMSIANPDVLGYLGDIDIAVEGLKYVDNALKEICEMADDNFYKVIITSDHGNVEDFNSSLRLLRTNNLVPFIIRDKKVVLKHKGNLTQIAPTILKYMDIAIPKEMQNTNVLIDED